MSVRREAMGEPHLLEGRVAQECLRFLRLAGDRGARDLAEFLMEDLVVQSRGHARLDPFWLEVRNQNVGLIRLCASTLPDDERRKTRRALAELLISARDAMPMKPCMVWRGPIGPTMVGSIAVEGQRTERAHFEAVATASGERVCRCARWEVRPMEADPKERSLIGFRNWSARVGCPACEAKGTLPEVVS